jgi:hypothetical protein
MTISIYLANELNDHVLRNEAYTAPSSVWIALLTASTGLDANNPTNEVSGFGYGRIEVGGASGRNFTASASKNSENAQNIEFPAANGGSWGTVTHVAIVDHGTNVTWGSNVNVLFWGALTASRTVNDGQVFRFLTGELDSLFA